MRTTLRCTRLCPLLVWLIVLCPLGAIARGPEQDVFEEKAIARAIERAVERAKWAGKTDRALWVKELEAVFPGKVGNPSKEEEYAAWFKLLAGEGDQWKRDSTDNKALLDLYDRTVQQMGLGPVPTLRKDEFMRYARNVLAQGNLQQALDTKDEADRMFRILDRDADGILAADEFTTKLADDLARADADGNGRIDKDEYRESYHRRVTSAADVLAKAFLAGGKGGGAGWAAELDLDKDGQIALHEWRRGGRKIADFVEMDLNGDGLLTMDEFARYTRMKEMQLKADPPDGVPPR